MPGKIAKIFDGQWVSGRRAFLSDNRLFQMNQRGRKYPLHAGKGFFAFGCAQCYGQVRSASIRVYNCCDPGVWRKWWQVVAAPEEIGITTAARVRDALTIHDETDGIAHRMGMRRERFVRRMRCCRARKSRELKVPAVTPSRRALWEYWTLTKPEINFLIAMATGAAFCAGCPTPVANFPWTLPLHTLLGTVLVSSGAGTLNQLIERNFDAQMRRTARRPIAAGRVGVVQALAFGSLLSVAGLYLALTVPIAASLLALLTFGWYLFLYTPLKRQTPICTFVGAFSGAMPVLIGYVAASGKLDFSAWLLFAILFLWQFSHFMAIAWMYREDYARAGYRVLPPGPEKSKLVEWQSVLPALALMPITVASLILQQANQLRVVATLLLSLSFLCFAARLAGIRSNGSARQLLLVSVVYLPLVFLLHVLARV